MNISYFWLPVNQYFFQRIIMMSYRCPRQEMTSRLSLLQNRELIQDHWKSQERLPCKKWWTLESANLSWLLRQFWGAFWSWLLSWCASSRRDYWGWQNGTKKFPASWQDQRQNMLAIFCSYKREKLEGVVREHRMKFGASAASVSGFGAAGTGSKYLPQRWRQNLPRFDTLDEEEETRYGIKCKQTPSLFTFLRKILTIYPINRLGNRLTESLNTEFNYTFWLKKAFAIEINHKTTVKIHR